MVFGTSGSMEGEPWKSQDSRGAAMSLCSDRRVGMGHPNAHNAILTACKLGFFIDLNWWNARIERLLSSLIL